MIDIHSHLLPGVDDGSPSLDVSKPVLDQFAADGVECIVLTPHLNSSQAASAPYDHHVALWEELRGIAPPSLDVKLGWEIMLDEPNVDLRSPRYSLGGSRAILVEFPRMAVPARAGDELYRLRCSGVVPVVAHPERYWGCTPDIVDEWRRAGAVIQMDIAGLMSKSEIGSMSRQLLREGLVDIFASDNHGDSRSLAHSRNWLLEVSTPEHAELLTRTNARRLLDGQPLHSVPPMNLPRTMISRLRQLFRRR